MSNPSRSENRTPSTNSGVTGTFDTSGMTPGLMQSTSFGASLGVDMGTDVAKGHVDGDLEGTSFDALNTMQDDASGWNFTDFWSFDMAGEL
jgi:hypothetical protein